MPAYPSYDVGLGSEQTPENMMIVDLSQSGTIHHRQVRSTQYYIFRVVHKGLTTAQYRSLMDTYAADPDGDYTGLVWYAESPAVSYTVNFLEPPRVISNHTGGLHDVEVLLRGS